MNGLESSAAAFKNPDEENMVFTPGKGQMKTLCLHSVIPFAVFGWVASLAVELNNHRSTGSILGLAKSAYK